MCSYILDMLKNNIYRNISYNNKINNLLDNSKCYLYNIIWKNRRIQILQGVGKKNMEEIEIKELFNIFWKKKFIIIAVAIIFAVVGGSYSVKFKKPMYKSSTTLLLAQNYEQESNKQENEITQTDISLNQKLVSTYSELVKSKTVIKTVLQNLGMDQQLEEEIADNITVNAVSDTQVIEITYINEDANIAFNIANELSNVFCDKVKEIYNINNVYIVDKAEIPEEPYNINHIKTTIIFGLAGGVLTCAIVFILSLFDTTVKTSEEIEKNTGLNVLAQVPEIKVGGKK